MPSASSCLLHVFGFAEYPYQTESKRDKNGRSLFLENMENYGRKINANQCPRWSQGRGRACPPGRAPYPREPTVRRLMLCFCHKKANIRKKITTKVSGQSELRISIYTRNGETEPEQNAKTEGKIQSRRGSRPSQAMGAKDQRVNPSPI